MTELTRRRTLAGAGAALLTGLAGCSGLTPFVGVREEYSETYDAAESLEIECETGSVRVRSARRSDVGVGVVEEASSLAADLSTLTLETERADGRLTLRSEWAGDAGPLSGRPSMDLDVEVPRETAVERVRTGTGKVDIRNTAGDLGIEVGTGSVDARNVAGAVSVDSETGSVTVRGTDAVGELSSETGSIEADLRNVRGDTEVQTQTGSIEVAVGPNLDAVLEARVGTGSLTVGDLGLSDVTRTDGLVRGTLGDGGPTLAVGSETGSIDVTRMDG
jgi:DUF4097 and DUF4098 domain-containing protein YvlB